MGMLDDYVAALKGVPLNEAIPGGAGTTPEGAPTALSGMISGATSLPQRAIENSQNSLNTGNYDPSVPVEAAATLTGVGAPMAEAGAAGIFGGKLAKTADLKALNEAKLMASHGMHPESVLGDTGWFRNPADHQWRFEIPDFKSDLKYMPTAMGDKALGSVDSLVHHPELFKAYPDLQSYRMEISKDMPHSGMFDSENKLLQVNAPTHGEARSVALHELQHGVQGIEDFSAGNNPSFYAYQIEQGLKKRPDVGSIYDFDTLKNQAHDLYRRTAGEVEARNVQTRSNMIPSTLSRNLPWQTQDVPFIDQLHFDPKTQMLTALKDTRK